MQFDSEPGNTLQDDVDITDGNADPVADSPLSQLSGSIRDEATVDVQSIPTERTYKFVFSAAAEDNDDGNTAPPPQKKTKKTSTRP